MRAWTPAPATVLLTTSPIRRPLDRDELLHRLDIAVAERLSLSNFDAGFRWNNRVFAAGAEGVSWIVHDGPIIIFAEVDAVQNVLIEIVTGVLQDLGKLDGDELIAILSALLVPKPDGVADFVNTIARRAGRAENYVLPSAATPDRRSAAASGAEDDEITVSGIGRISLHESDRRIFFPVLDCVGDTLRVRQIGINLEGNRVVLPTELGADDAGAEGFDAFRLDARIVFHELLDGLRLGHGSKNDASFEHRETVDRGVGDLLPACAERFDPGRVPCIACQESFSHRVLPS